MKTKLLNYYFLNLLIKKGQSIGGFNNEEWSSGRGKMDYYKIMDERYEFIEKQRTELEKMGIKDRGWNRKETRLFMCAVCKKQKYE